MSRFVEEFKQRCIDRMRENTPRIETCLSRLSEEEVWHRPNGSSNSVGNLIIHLCGNITQYILSSLGGSPDQRDRDSEFTITGGLSRKELMQRLSGTVDQAVQVIAALDETALLKRYSVQGYDYTGIASVIHVVEHYSYHTGQIAFWTKYLRDQDLGFYAGKDLNVKNKS